tara:strand:- start:1343 stop:1663 length:321 start_codon:yes stop_codon:yes gene_type:complete
VIKQGEPKGSLHDKATALRTALKMKSASEGVLMTISRFIPKKEVARILGVSVSTVIRWSKTGILPQPFELGPNKTMYVRDEIEDYIAHAKEKRVFYGGRTILIDSK